MPTLERDEEAVKKGKGQKIQTQNKLITRLQVLLAQTRAAKNSDKLKV